MDTKRNNGISVIICCYNSASRINKTLEYLSKQETKQNLNWEIILIDNNSTDNTVHVAKKQWDFLGRNIPLYIFNEAQQGLVFAKQKGISESNFDLLLFCDDDNWLDKNYISLAFNYMQKDASLGLIGGKGTAVFEKGFSPPEWFAEAAKFHYAVHQPEQEKTGHNATHVYGAGSIIRKEIFDQLVEKQYHLILSGRTGEKITSGEDIEISFLAKLLGYRVQFIPDLKFLHFLPKAKISTSWISKKSLDSYSPLIISAYMDVYFRNIKSPLSYYFKILQQIFNIVLISIKKTFLLDWGFYSRLWLKSQLSFCFYKLQNYLIYKNTILHIQQLINNIKTLEIERRNQ